ncbi:2-dehydropantoate 2-reductase [Aquibacillus koreensis]|uniref:2-dehydropantoate 2-reductase n=1 Tax=Aquibacillus koreensis TaxID=279446 RepID=A0A9X4AHA5_9BACI|nr:2-dehydropantoate 2-reductase [Aquibacillus koreensis]MCT2537100.1 2-dehydropantoate 2-reductase [Aquibacillus koreensis]MDC3419917.1 2-dehydropantoate 2-reductase [Aquibacillus koreensis]
MTITIIGAGAIGGVLGAYLSRSGHDVTFCDIVHEHVEKINQDGLTIEGPEETFSVKAMALTPEQLVKRNKPLETIFLCVKAHHTEEALKPLLPLLDDKSNVVSLQNGLCERQIAALIGPERTIGCFVNFSADYLEPGRILYGGVASLYLGELSGELTPRISNLKDQLQCWGPAQVTDNIWGYLWGKMSYAGLLYATALVDETMAGVVRKLDLRDTLLELCSEILEIADKEGVSPLGFDDWEPQLVYPRGSRNKALLDDQLEKLADRMATNKKTKSGIWRDLAVRKRKTEVDAQLLPILDIGKSHQIDTPLLTALITSIKEIEIGTRQMNWDNLYDLKEIYQSLPNKVS